MMNCYKTAATVGDHMFFSLIKSRTISRRLPNTKPFLSRSQSQAAESSSEASPGQHTADKPRLRAIDLARKVRQEKARTRTEQTEPPVSAMQQRVTELKRFSLQLQNVHPNVLAKHLHKNLLYQDKDVVIINKPYGVPVREDSGVTSITSVLPVLSKMMDGLKVKNDSNLLPCLSLEKDSTGVLLLARSEAAAENILHLSRNNQLERRYWVITVGVPVPSEGLIDIPIIEREVSSPQPHFKMTLSPLYRMNEAGEKLTKVRGHRQAHPAVTKYRVLDSSYGCSLVELQALTGVKHQMRVHMAYALGCPILGDHKYSHWSKLAPQKLPEGVLKKLGLEQTKSRHLPLHLHARHLVLPGHSGSDVSTSCPLPKYFIKTLNRLRLTFPEDKNNK
ncbi:PREDICTED: RNA pseudouridylate synthase domain-containing protein 4-like [Cyprinodon variegatus]|uniref:Pseudouridylate synthase RPUSD4, mitochondrial n=1 Tax=Cyprinodon variegatus TaxID=28743 RepID=A0A3Q2FNY7_CYPVA|nr:PREDICTED: RNA pseudouridylate synthase domain-containing protein 4-like [Cyprinodon variegatus]